MKPFVLLTLTLSFSGVVHAAATFDRFQFDRLNHLREECLAVLDSDATPEAKAEAVTHWIKRIEKAQLILRNLAGFSAGPVGVAGLDRAHFVEQLDKTLAETKKLSVNDLLTLRALGLGSSPFTPTEVEELVKGMNFDSYQPYVKEMLVQVMGMRKTLFPESPEIVDLARQLELIEAQLALLECDLSALNESFQLRGERVCTFQRDYSRWTRKAVTKTNLVARSTDLWGRAVAAFATHTLSSMTSFAAGILAFDIPLAMSGQTAVLGVGSVITGYATTQVIAAVAGSAGYLSYRKICAAYLTLRQDRDSMQENE